MRFNINAPFWRFMDTLLRFVGLNLVYLITLIPNVTIGPARAALYSTMFAYDEHDDIRLVKEYLTRFKREFKQGLAAWVLVAILATAILFGLSFWKAWDTNAPYIPLILLVIAAVVGAALPNTLHRCRHASPTPPAGSSRYRRCSPGEPSPARSSSSSSTYSRPACHISYRSYAFSPSSSASPGWRMRNPSFCCGASNGMAERAKWRIRNMSMRTSRVRAFLQESCFVGDERQRIVDEFAQADFPRHRTTPDGRPPTGWTRSPACPTPPRPAIPNGFRAFRRRTARNRSTNRPAARYRHRPDSVLSRWPRPARRWPVRRPPRSAHHGNAGASNRRPVPHRSKPHSFGHSGSLDQRATASIRFQTSASSASAQRISQRHRHT